MINNPNFVLPKVFFIGSTSLNLDSLRDYLSETNQQSFLEEIEQAEKEGLNRGEILCSFYAKLCYASLTTTKNKNISKVRAISDNLLNILETGHGSVLEHCYLNFVVTDCSRVFTHELVRHRVGTSFSQTSGRYVRNDVLRLVIDPILKPVYDRIEEVRLMIETMYKDIESRMMFGVEDFGTKKKITSAMRRILPNGQSNEIGFGCNLRTLRQTIEARTSRHAEWEIRVIFNQIYNLVKEKYPMIFSDVKLELIDNQNEITFKNKKI